MHYMRMPVVLLERALYGHPLAGAFWHHYCAKICKAAGFRFFSDNWPCCYWHDETCTMLIVYVDDMKLAGPSHLMKQAWDALGEGIQLECPRGNDEKEGQKKMTFLGCEHRLVERTYVTA